MLTPHRAHHSPTPSVTTKWYGRSDEIQMGRGVFISVCLKEIPDKSSTSMDIFD